VVEGDARLLLPQLSDASIDFVFTDPPFGHNNNNGDLIHQREAALGRLPSGVNPPVGRPIANDGEEANDLVREAFAQFNRLLRRGGCCCCCCCGGGPDPQFARWSLWLDEAIGFKHMVVWDKGPMGMGWHYRRSYETVLVGMKPGGPCKWYDTTDRIENIIRNIPKIIPQADDHPTPKPLALIEHFIRLHSEEGDVVLDPFFGHGPVGIAAKKLGRHFLGFELDAGFARIARERIALVEAQPSLFEKKPEQMQLVGDP
jgi:DNA modification methylase